MRFLAAALIWVVFLTLAVYDSNKSPNPPVVNPSVSAPAPQPVQTVDGKEIYEKYCAMCHGVSGKGDGLVAEALSDKPIDLTLPATQKKSDGKLVKVIRDGTDKGMFPWKNKLKDEEIKTVVKYLRELGNK